MFFVVGEEDKSIQSINIPAARMLALPKGTGVASRPSRVHTFCPQVWRRSSGMTAQQTAKRFEFRRSRSQRLVFVTVELSMRFGRNKSPRTSSMRRRRPPWPLHFNRANSTSFISAF